MQSGTREQVRKLLEAGLSVAEIASTLGIQKQTVCYHKRRLGFPIDAKCARRYDWDEIQFFYDQGHSLSECQARFGFNRASWHQAVLRGDLISRPAGMPLDVLLDRVKRGRNHIKLRLMKAGLKENSCEECGISDWRGEPISLELHHINGDGIDNRIENLQILCPNCHSQTPTWGGRNRKRAA